MAPNVIDHGLVLEEALVLASTLKGPSSSHPVKSPFVRTTSSGAHWFRPWTWKWRLLIRTCRKCRRSQTLLRGIFVGLFLITLAANLVLVTQTLLTTSFAKVEDSKLAAGEEQSEKIVHSAIRPNALRLQEVQTDPGLSLSTLSMEASASRFLTIEVLSSQKVVRIIADGTTILDHSGKSGRGIHVLVLHQATGAVMANRLFDTYSPHEDEALAHFLALITPNRIIVMAVKDEASFHLGKYARKAISKLGAKRAYQMGWRDMWGVVLVKRKATSKKDAKLFGESFSKSPGFHQWGSPVMLRAEVPLVPLEDTICDKWDKNQSDYYRRIEFCSRYEGYGSICSCERNPLPISGLSPLHRQIPNNRIANVPVTIIASNRPQYLYRMVRSLLSADGADPAMITVFIDGFYDEPLAVARLFGLRGIQHAPVGERNARISQHYKASLSTTFDLYPDAEYAIVLEEDLDVSPDFFSYFSQTLVLLEEDTSVYCVSAWNDQGYEHTASDPEKLLRVETMPGLGWILKKDLFKNELEPNWPTPERMWDWDMWMRLPENRRGRECIVPEMSRTYHFGSVGINMNSYFQDIYFKKHAFNTKANVELHQVLSLKSDAYEELVHSSIAEASIVSTDISPCSEDFKMNNTRSDVGNVLFIKMQHAKDFMTWLEVAKCLHIWDLDPRGYHRGMWKIRYHGEELFVVGVPYSDYAIYKPDDVRPLALNKEDKKKSLK